MGAARCAAVDVGIAAVPVHVRFKKTEERGLRFVKAPVLLNILLSKLIYHLLNSLAISNGDEHPLAEHILYTEEINSVY